MPAPNVAISFIAGVVMSDSLAILPVQDQNFVGWAVPEPPRSPVHEFWTRAGEVKDLRREMDRLKRAMHAPPPVPATAPR